MVCPFCSSTDTNVVNSRAKKRTARVWRRRACLNCSAIFTTNELPNYEQLTVIKRNARKEKFSYPKLFISVWRACEPLKSPQDTSEAICESIMERVLKQSTNGEVSTEQISEIAGGVLQRYNSGAFVRYISFQTSVNSDADLRKAMRFHKKK